MVNPDLACESKSAKDCADELDALATELTKRIDKLKAIENKGQKVPPEAVSVIALHAAEKLGQAAWEM